MDILITGATCIVGEKYVHNVDIFISDGIITAIGNIPTTDPENITVVEANGNLVVPGFIDLQVNGGVKSFLTHSITVETMEEMYYDHLACGTTSMLPTIVTTSFENICNAISVAREYQHAGKPGVHGLHIEGPFINMERKGAHNPKHIRTPSEKELSVLLKEGEGIIKMITIAPELFTLKQVAMFREAGIVVAAGHSAVSDQDVRPYFNKGVTCVTHLYNAMSPFQSREAGLTGGTLDSDVFASIVADGFHCSMTALRIAHRLKKGKLFLVSDATFIGKEDLEMDGIKFIYQPGIYVNSRGNLAGSNITMLDAVKVCVHQAGISVADTLQMAASIPAEVLGIHHQYGMVLPGYAADLNILAKDSLKLVTSIVKGREILIKKEDVGTGSN